MIRVALLLALTAAAAAAAVHVDLAGEWRFQAGDDPAWAAPDFDDSRWTLVPLPRRGPGFTGASWLRRSFQLPSEAAGVRLVLTLGTFAETYEVYCDGTRIAAVGQTSETLFFARPRSFRLPEGLLRPGRPFVVALRHRLAVFQGGFPRQVRALPDEGPYVLTDDSGAPRHAERLGTLLRERLATVGLVSGALRVLLMVILLGAWLTEPRRRELLVLALLHADDGVLRLAESMGIVLDLSAYFWHWFTLALAMAAGSIVGWFAFEAFQVRSRWFRALIWIPLASLIISPISLSMTLAAARDISVFLFCLYAAWRAAAKEGWRSGSTALALSTSAVLLLMTQRLGALAVVHLYRLVGGYLFHLYDIFVIVLTTGMTLHLLLRLGADRREKERLSSEMESARTVQQLLLTAPAAAAGYETAAEYHPALQVGGDFYWTGVEDDGALTVTIGDVSGKGLRAAMLASMASGILGQARGLGPAALLKALNRELSGRMGGGFVTCCCARFGPGGEVTIANAGHVAPYLDGREIEVSGLPLGVAADADYTETAVSGQRFTFLSDGVVEAANATGELFGFDRTREISMKPAREIVEAARAWGQNDDITVVTVRRNL